MSMLRILGAVALAVLMMAPDAMAQRRGGGGAVSSGVRGAMVGGMAGGSSGAQKGAKAGVVVGATRGVAERSADRRAMDSETQSRTQYESSAAYQNAQHSNFDEAPPEVLITSSADALPRRRPRRRRTKTVNRSFARMASPSWGSRIRPIGSRKREATIFPPSVRREMPGR